MPPDHAETLLKVAEEYNCAPVSPACRAGAEAIREAEGLRVETERLRQRRNGAIVGMGRAEAATKRPSSIQPPDPPHPFWMAALEARVRELEDQWRVVMAWVDQQPRPPKAPAPGGAVS
jgi:hypothetical protein